MSPQDDERETFGDRLLEALDDIRMALEDIVGVLRGIDEQLVAEEEVQAELRERAESMRRCIDSED